MIVWEKKTPLTHYQVRSAGQSLRLYSNGVFHSQFNPSVIFGGQVWDLLWLPALYTEKKIKRVLVLGVGGGAVIRQIDQVIEPEQIVGVELDKTHISIAKRFFGISGLAKVELVHADAIAWLQSYRGKKFDLIIDDLFCHGEGEAKRAIKVDGDWAYHLLKVLSSDGCLVINFESQSSLQKSALNQSGQQFNSRWQFRINGFDNRIGAFFKGNASREMFRQKLRQLNDSVGNASVKRLNAITKKLR